MVDFLNGFKFKLLVAGELVETPTTFVALNPATEERIADVPMCTQEIADKTVLAAQEAFKTWREVDLNERAILMNKVADIILQNVDSLSKLLTAEQGKPVGMAHAEIIDSVHFVRECAEKIKLPIQDISGNIYNPTAKVKVYRRPIGVVVGITPWNFPAFCSIQKWAPALMCGNTYIHKPSPYTPLTALAIAFLIQNCFPKGVFNVLTCSDTQEFNLGKYLVNHPGVRKITFTGSTNTGKGIFQSCANDVKRITLEMGGNDPAIIREDVDIKEAAKGVVGASMFNTGQVCCAIKRAYVHESIYDKFVEECKNCLETDIKMGDGSQEGITHGPLNNKMQYDRVKMLVDSAKQQGAHIISGNKVSGYAKGYYFEPTIVTGVNDSSLIVAEEQFGPVLPILKYNNDLEVLRKANDSSYGLGASVWTKDMTVAADMASKLEAGTIWINEHASLTGGPFGGFKQSGYGRELGDADVQSFTEIQTICIH